MSTNKVSNQVQTAAGLQQIIYHEQHDSLALITPRARFARTRRGFRATGNIDQLSFDRLVKFVDDFKGSYGQAFRALVQNPDTLTELFPQWAEPAREFKVGEEVLFDSVTYDRIYGACVVEKVNRVNVVVKSTVTGQRVTCPKEMFVEPKKVA